MSEQLITRANKKGCFRGMDRAAESLITWSLLVGALLMLFPPGAAAQSETNIRFYKESFSHNVDFRSYPGMLLLKHQVGKFYKVFKNPVFQPSPSGWDRQDVADPYVVVTPDSVYLYYDGDSDERYHIGYAVLDERGWDWMRRGRVFEGSGQDWDSFHQIAPVVLFATSQDWMLFYSGNAQDSQLGYRMGVAMGVHKRFNPMAGAPLWTPDSTDWDIAGAGYADVLYFPEEKVYRMWYTGFEGLLAAIGLAESRNGRHWGKVGKEPVLKRLPGVIAPEIVFNGEYYTMYFVQLYFENGLKTKICRTQSSDGHHWQEVEDILLPSEKWEGRKLMRPNISFYNNEVHLFYCAQKGSRWQIGEARAKPDFVSEGLWESPKLPPSHSKLKIIYEQPPGTTLEFHFVETITAQKYLANLSDSVVVIRKGVRQSILNVPEPFRNRPFKIRLHLATERPERSPIIYQVSHVE